jgi:antitoxin (DNA-binding transcriptional repressor) of toxin-antitoxin stability system
MKARISVTELSQDLRSILDRVRRRGDSFLIEQDGEAVAALEPVAAAATWASLAKQLGDAPHPGSEFATDLEEIQRHQPDVPTDVWPS